MGQRTVVIGLDGFTFSVVDRLVATGKMPVFARLMREGVRAPLRSTIMPNSFPGWTSCATGCNEGKHGIFMPLVRRADNFSMKAMDSTDVRVKTVWEVLSDRGRRCVVINDPCSYPPHPIDKGCVVSGMTTPDTATDWTHPSDLRDELLARVPRYVVDVNLYGKSRAQILDELTASADERLEAALYLLGSREWDLFWVTFTESDRVQHRFWADQQPDHPHHNPEFPGAVDSIYRQLDRAVGAIVDALPSDTRIFVVSDHGFGPFYCHFNTTGWLLDNGYMAQTSARAGVKRALAKLGLLDDATAAYRRFRQMVETSAKHGVAKMREQAAAANSGPVYANVDWSRTTAYATLDGGIRVNLRGREPQGIVEREDAPALVEEISEQLAALVFPNGEPIFEAVLRADEVFDGPFAGRGPDIVIPVRWGAYRGPVAGHKYLSDRHRNSGEHDRYGVFVAVGTNIQRGVELEGASLVDIAPTVLYSLGEAPTDEMDGRVLVEAFEPSTRPTREVETAGSSAKERPEGEGLSSDEEALLEERLRGLGYIE
jgi:predicted AlkP superfamily phosphohydrolase/phosphomutase